LTRPEPIPVDVEDLPEIVRDALRPDSPREQRLLLARAVIPLGPLELVSTLTLLLDDKSDKVSDAAKTSIEGLPWGVLSNGISESRDPGVLDRVSREYIDREEVLSLTIANPAVSANTLAFVASKGRGRILEDIASNQVMLERNPGIIEALYYNPETRMGTISSVLEFAVRTEIDLSHIPGYREIVESVFGSEKPVEPPIGAPSKDKKAGFDEALAEEPCLDLEGEMEDFLDDEAFSMVLQVAAWDEGPEDEEENEGDNKALWSKIGKMPIVQKVRLALLGNDFVRSMLIRDSRRIVFMAVLNSPKTSEKEIVSFAKNRALDDEIVRTISKNRDWTKLYEVRHSLIKNPKCPPAVAMNFLRTLNPRDVRNLSHSHDVPGYVVRAAKRLIQQREERR